MNEAHLHTDTHPLMHVAVGHMLQNIIHGRE